MVRGEGEWSVAEKNKKYELGKKMKRVKEKSRKITLKRRKKALKMHLPKNVFAPPAANLFVGEKNLISKEGGNWSECTIYMQEKYYGSSFYNLDQFQNRCSDL